jgi:ABC-type phosphate transport system permease subunit
MYYELHWYDTVKSKPSNLHCPRDVYLRTNITYIYIYSYISVNQQTILSTAFASYIFTALHSNVSPNFFIQKVKDKRQSGATQQELHKTVYMTKISTIIQLLSRYARYISLESSVTFCVG